MKEFNWEKFIVTAFCLFLGAALLGCLVPISEYMEETTSILSKLPELGILLNWIALTCGLVGFLGYFYYLHLLKKDGYSNEEGSFYDQKHNQIRIVKTFSIFCSIFTLMSLGLTMLNDMADYYNWVFFLNAFLGCMGEIANRSLIAKARPELEEDLTGFGLNRTYFEHLDEREKEKAGRASFKAMNLMGFAYFIALLTCYVLIGRLDISPVICMPVGVLWLLQTVIMLYYSCKEK